MSGRKLVGPCVGSKGAHRVGPDFPEMPFRPSQNAEAFDDDGARIELFEELLRLVPTAAHALAVAGCRRASTLPMPNLERSYAAFHETSLRKLAAYHKEADELAPVGACT